MALWTMHYTKRYLENMGLNGWNNVLAICARNDMWAKVSALQELQSASGEELSPSLRFGDGSQSALMPSVLNKAFKGEL
jgi:hypothetical protein